MLEDTTKRIVYVPVSVEMLPALEEWSEPVQVRLERDAKGDFSFVFRKVEWRPVEHSKGRAAEGAA